MESSNQQALNPLMIKLQKVLETRIENDEDLVEGLQSLSVYFNENNIRTRRNLRSQIERREVDVHKEFLREFTTVKEKFDEIDAMVTGMYDSCQEMTQRLQATKSQTQDLIQQTTQLQAASRKLEMKAQIADSFLVAFQLSKEETKLLKGDFHARLNDDFFRALARMREIKENCKLLLRSHNQTAGLEIMESMSIHVEAAYEKLYRWTQSECRLQNQESAEIPAILCQAMEALQDRPVLFKYTLDEYGSARRSAVVKAFIDALTRGGSTLSASPPTSPTGVARSNSGLKPIEVHSHDPLRYSGDMLAWLHQAAASEKESLNTLLRRCGEMATTSIVAECLDHVTEGVCRPFKMRMEQILISEQDSVTLYKINNLLHFYKGTLEHLVGKEAGLSVTLEEMQLLSWRLFFNALKTHARQLLEQSSPPEPDLSPPRVMHATLGLLQDILTAQDVSMLPSSVRKQEFQQVLNALIDPLLQHCSISGSQLGSVDAAIYLTNCLYTAQTALARLEFTDLKLEQVQAHLDANLDTLVSEQASHVLTRTQLAPIYQHLQQEGAAGKDVESQTPLATVEGLGQSEIKSAMGMFDCYLASPDSLIMPQCRLLHSVKLRDMIRKRSADLVHTAYTDVHRAITDQRNRYREVQSLAPRTPDQVAQLILNF